MYIQGEPDVPNNVMMNILKQPLTFLPQKSFHPTAEYRIEKLLPLEHFLTLAFQSPLALIIRFGRHYLKIIVAFEGQCDIRTHKRQNDV